MLSGVFYRIDVNKKGPQKVFSVVFTYVANFVYLYFSRFFFFFLTAEVPVYV